MNKKVYIASPYTRGDQLLNVRRQINISDILMRYGYTPFVPLLSHFQHIIHPRTEKQWLDYDLVWLKTCDIMIRMRPLDKNGKEILSAGADLEEKIADENKIPVWTFKSEEDLENFCRGLLIEKTSKSASNMV